MSATLASGFQKVSFFTMSTFFNNRMIFDMCMFYLVLNMTRNTLMLQSYRLDIFRHTRLSPYLDIFFVSFGQVTITWYHSL